MSQTTDKQTVSASLFSTLERTLALTHAWGMTSATNDSWQYRDGDHLLTYNPAIAALQLTNTQTNEPLRWCDGQLMDDPEITSEQLAEFEELRQWLDAQNMPQTVGLADIQPFTSQEVAAIESTAARLFEHYASQEMAAYKLAEDSTIHYYSVDIDGITYRLSRDDATGSYNLEKDGSDLNLQTQQAISQKDSQLWTEIDQWLTLQSQLTSLELAESTISDWEQQEQWADWVFPIAERAFAFQEMQGTVQFDPARDSYVPAIAAYEIGYTPQTDILWVNRGRSSIFGRDHWQPEDLESLARRDVAFFQALDHWLTVKTVAVSESVILANRVSPLANDATEERRDRRANSQLQPGQAGQLDFDL